MNYKKVIEGLYNISPIYLLALSGLLFVLSFPPLPFSFLAFVGLIPFLIGFESDDYYFGFSKGFVFGAVLNLGILFWLAGNSGAPWYFAVLSMIGAVLALGVQYGVLGAVYAFIARKLGKNIALWGLPVIFAGFEFLTSRSVFGFTWNSLVYTQSSSIYPAQIASLIGGYGISFWLVLVNVLLFKSLRFFYQEQAVQARKVLISLLIVFLFPYIFGYFQVDTKAKKGKSIKAALIQPNVDPNAKWRSDEQDRHIEKLFSLSDSVLSNTAGTNFLVWPETAIPAYLRRNSILRTEIMRRADSWNVSLISGAPNYRKNEVKDEYEFYNTIYHFNPNKDSIETYSKIRLVPFGEKIPLSNIFESLEKINLGQGNYQSGDSLKLFQVPLQKGAKKLTISNAICYESGFSELIKKGVSKGAELLVIVTNDAWFGNTSAPYLHAEIARIRAIENQIPIVRAANTGISMILDKYGRVKKKIGFGKQGWLVDRVKARSGSTLYSKIGSFINWGFVVLSVVLLAAGIGHDYI